MTIQEARMTGSPGEEDAREEMRSPQGDGGKTLDYESPSSAQQSSPNPWRAVSVGPWLIGAGTIGVAGALLIGLGSIANAISRGSKDGDFAVVTGLFVLLIAAAILTIGLIQWFKG